MSGDTIVGSADLPMTQIGGPVRFAELVSLAEIEAARELLRDVAVVTPVEGSRPLSLAVGGPVLIKCENLQRTGSFKIRGAYVRIARLSDEERASGVVAASAGNHAQGVALAARLLGAKATIFMPIGAPLPKLEATKAYGAEVRLVGVTVDEALAAAQAHAEERGSVFVHPFEHRDVIAGQGTVGLEILEAVPDVRTVVVCSCSSLSDLPRSTTPNQQLRYTTREGHICASAPAYIPLPPQRARPRRVPSCACMARSLHTIAVRRTRGAEDVCSGGRWSPQAVATIIARWRPLPSRQLGR